MVTLNTAKYSIVKLEEVHSTNSYALENISFLEDRTVVFTPCQTLGRGRYDRVWINDDTENIFMSIVLKPDSNKNYPFQNLTQYLSVVVCKFLEEEFDIKSDIKWPNDILVDGCKISGILAETHTENNKIAGIVLGLGLNINLKPQTLDSINQKATSVAILKSEKDSKFGNVYNVDELLPKLLNKFFECYDEFVKYGFGVIKPDYISRCNFLGKDILIRDFDETKKYYAKSINDEGLLIVNDELNNECRIITGDVLC